MLKFGLPILPALKPIVEEFCLHGIGVYLHGKLGENLLFIDIDWKAAEFLSGQLSNSWTLIYAYFISNEAIINGESDPLSKDANLAEILRNYDPLGTLKIPIDENFDAMLERAQYLLQFPPSRLVYLDGDRVSTEALEEVKSLLQKMDASDT